MEVNIRVGADFSKLLDWLNHASFVVREHDRDQLGVAAQRAPNIVGIDESLAVDRYVADLNPDFLQMLAGVEHGVVLNGGSNDVISATN